MDASNLLKPALARGELHCVGATTLDEYRKHVEKDAALARRFQPVFVSEPTVEDTISILRGLKEKYELHHGVRISDAALVAAATLSNRYITDRFLPDKAIDLVDEAASRLRMQVDSKPEALDELDRRMMQLKIEREALKKENGHGLQGSPAKLEKELANLEEEANVLTARWQEEKGKLAGAQKLKEQLDAARVELEQAQRKGDFASAGELAYGVIPDLEAKLKKLEETEDKGGRSGAGGGHRRPHRPGGLALDRHPGRQDARRRARQALAHGGGDRQARGRPVGGRRRGVDRRAPLARRPAGPEPADRLVHVPWPDRRWQD